MYSTIRINKNNKQNKTNNMKTREEEIENLKKEKANSLYNTKLQNLENYNVKNREKFENNEKFEKFFTEIQNNFVLIKDKIDDNYKDQCFIDYMKDLEIRFEPHLGNYMRIFFYKPKDENDFFSSNEIFFILTFNKNNIFYYSTKIETLFNINCDIKNSELPYFINYQMMKHFKLNNVSSYLLKKQ